ncbi:F0F1 ATP synthase subunit delta [Brevibacillus daliensis]|uniref:F0F1 ATP synthase subunit delta n=1 Tax=Brevibacillus daliensis TaxID=2892995 RepID=UPI001E2C5693|nr:F0F1 ATP synthase subunit delta [Brevibacillus daliensis]
MSGAIAQRYARALFEIADERGLIDQIEVELQDLHQAVQQVPDFEKIFMHPHIDASSKKGLLDDLFLGKVTHETLNFLYVLIDNKREGELEEISKAYVEMANEKRGLADATVTTAKPISEEEIAQLGEQFSQLINKKLRLQSVVDPSILGGVVVKIGDRLYDGSLKTKLDNFAHQI